MERIGTISRAESGVDLAIEWKIAFFTLQEKAGVYYYSPEFSFGGKKWNLGIFPNGSRAYDSTGHVALFLLKLSPGPSLKQSFSLSLKTVRGQKYKEQHCMKDFKNWPENRYDSHRFIPRSELSRRKSDLAPENILTVVCTMKSSTPAGSGTGNDPEHAYVGASTQRVEASIQTVEAYIQTVEASTQTVEVKSEVPASGSSANLHENKLHHDFKELFLQKEDCDVTIKVKGSEFPAHRVILKARSPVFASTFRHDMKENATGIVEIDDCDPSSFSDFLYFVYCGDATIISQENIFSLFRAADKYQVLDLRAMCLELIRKNVSVDTFCETITLALQHSETELIKLCTDYFKKNIPKIIVTVKWQTFLAENPMASNELFVKSFVPNSS